MIYILAPSLIKRLEAGTLTVSLNIQFPALFFKRVVCICVTLDKVNPKHQQFTW